MIVKQEFHEARDCEKAFTSREGNNSLVYEPITGAFIAMITLVHIPADYKYNQTSSPSYQSKQIVKLGFIYLLTLPNVQEWPIFDI